MMRKRTLEYDDVMNAQRTEIYSFRSEALTSESPREQLLGAAEDAIASRAQNAVDSKDKAAIQEFIAWVNTTFPLGLTEEHLPAEKSMESLCDFVMERVKQAYELKASHEDPESLARLERHLILQSIDEHWQEYLRNMDSLRESIGLRAYGQRDPLVEYKREAYTLFMDLMERIYEEIATAMFRSATSVDAIQEFFQSLKNMQTRHPSASALASAAAQAGAMPAAQPQPQQARRPQGPPPGMRPVGAPPPGMDLPEAPKPAAPIRNTARQVGRNDPCPCGSGRKYKKCCGSE